MKIKTTMSITSHWPTWPSSKNLQAINAGEGVEKGEPSYSVEESHTLKEYMYSNVHFSTIYNSQYKEATLMYMEEWIKMWYICTMEY